MARLDLAPECMSQLTRSVYEFSISCRKNIGFRNKNKQIPLAT
jgi:hypothetical protein